MAGERIRLEVAEREVRGSAESRRLRKRGLVPGVLYGRGHQPRAIAIPERELRRVLTTSAGLHAILDVVLEGQKTTHASILKDHQEDPLRGRLIHVDLQEVRLDQPIQAQVVVNLIGEAAGADEGGVLSQVTREVMVEALPMEIPEHIDLDVSGMHVGDALRLADLPAMEGVAYLDDPEETVLATVTLPTPEIVEEAEAAEEGVLGEEELPEGAAGEPADAGGDAAGEPGTVPG
ncbi:MAG: 50S ribosomal protein L25 [Actinobacteria bacterium]|nr:50S ribosomal protein L25 [Actinomycetota bacterium]